MGVEMEVVVEEDGREEAAGGRGAGAEVEMATAEGQECGMAGVELGDGIGVDERAAASPAFPFACVTGGGLEGGFQHQRGGGKGGMDKQGDKQAGSKQLKCPRPSFYYIHLRPVTFMPRGEVSFPIQQPCPPPFYVKV